MEASEFPNLNMEEKKEPIIIKKTEFTVDPTNPISSNLSLLINDSILISLSLALRNNPSFVKLKGEL